MKKFLLVTLLLAVSVTTYGQRNRTPHPLDEKYGYKTITFGDSIQWHDADVRLLGEVTDTKAYEATNESFLSIGNIPVEDLLILVYNDIVYGVSYVVPGIHALEFKNALIEAFGNRYSQPNQFMDEFIWRGQRTVLNYDYSRVRRNVKVLMVATDIQERIEQDKARQSRAASQDL